MFKNIFLLSLLLITQFTFAMDPTNLREKLLAKAKAMTPDEIWIALDPTKRDAKGNTPFGKCLIQRGCSGCACKNYFKGWYSVKPGAYDTANQAGWPKNGSAPGTSSGCLDSCYDGHVKATMCTSDLKANIKAVLINALDNAAHRYPGWDDVCGLSQLPPEKKVSLSLLDTSKLVFVKPSETPDGSVLCGTTSIGDKVGQFESFNQLPADYCFAAYGVLRSGMASFRQQGRTDIKDSHFISLADYQKKQLDSKVLADAKGVFGSLNTVYSACDFIPYCDYSPDQLSAMTSSEVALYFVALDEKRDGFPASLLPKVDALTADELAAARIAYKAKTDTDVDKGQNFTIDEAIKVVTDKK